MLEANFISGYETVTVQGLTQWDKGQKLQIAGLASLPATFQVHFANTTTVEAIVMLGSTVAGVGNVDIPNSLLESSLDIKAWIYLIDAEGSETIKTILFPLTKRTKPADFISVPNPTEQSLLEQTMSGVNAATANMQTQINSTNAQVALKANQSDLDATNVQVATKANQTSIDATNAIVALKADKSEVTNVMTPKGNLAYASLPTTGNTVGWYYYCPDGDGVHGAGNYVWNGTAWYFGGTGDQGYNIIKKELLAYDISPRHLFFKIGFYATGVTPSYYPTSQRCCIEAIALYTPFKFVVHDGSKYVFSLYSWDGTTKTAITSVISDGLEITNTNLVYGILGRNRADDTTTLTENDLPDINKCLSIIPLVYSKEFSSFDDKINVQKNKLDSFIYAKNLLNRTTKTDGYYVRIDNGNLDANDTFSAFDFVDIRGYSKLTLSYIHIAVWYDKNKAYISQVANMDSIANDQVIDVPANACYIRASTYNTALKPYTKYAQIGVGELSRESYIPYGKTIVNPNRTIYVDATGAGDYLSILEATMYTQNDIIVRPGSYDIIQEYMNMFGNDIFNTMLDSDYNNFGSGILIENRTITFMPGSFVTADYSETTYASNKRFCPFNMGDNAVIDGLHCVSNACYYMIHDDFQSYGKDCINVIKNCVLIATNIRNHNVIGGGLREHDTHIVENCYMDNGLDSTSETVRYHHTHKAGSHPTVIIKNCKVNGHIGCRYFGNHSDKALFIINNNYAPGGVVVEAETIDSTINNITLYEWNNQNT